jgi:hypothetical protein
LCQSFLLASAVHLLATVLIAVETGGRQIFQFVGTAIHLSLQMFNGQASRAGLRENTLAIAAFSTLTLA